MKKLTNLFITIVLVLVAIFSRIGAVSADNPSGTYYHKILKNGHCVDQEFKNPALANENGFTLLGKCPTPTSIPTNIIPTATRIIPTPTNVIPTSTRINPTPTNFVATSTRTSVVPTSTITQPTATQVSTFTPTSTSKTSTPNPVNSATPTITPFPLRANAAVPNCPQTSNGFLPWIFLILGSIGTGLGIGNAQKIRTLTNHH